MLLIFSYLILFGDGNAAQLHGCIPWKKGGIQQGILKGEVSLYWFGIGCMTTDNFCFYLQNRLIQTSQTGGQLYSDTSPWIQFLASLAPPSQTAESLLRTHCPAKPTRKIWQKLSSVNSFQWKNTLNYF